MLVLLVQSRAVLIRNSVVKIMTHTSSTTCESTARRQMHHPWRVEEFIKQQASCYILVASLLIAMPGAPSSFLFLVVRPGAPSSVLAPNSDALCYNTYHIGDSDLTICHITPFCRATLPASREAGPVRTCCIGPRYREVWCQPGRAAKAVTGDFWHKQRKGTKKREGKQRKERKKAHLTKK